MSHKTLDQQQAALRKKQLTFRWLGIAFGLSSIFGAPIAYLAGIYRFMDDSLIINYCIYVGWPLGCLCALLALRAKNQVPQEAQTPVES